MTVEIIKLNKYLCNIIDQYNDHSIDSLSKLYDLNYHLETDIKKYNINIFKDYPLIDLIIICLKLGSSAQGKS